MGSKRSHAEMNSLDSPFIHMFEQFKKELDEHHDRRERVIKASRDVTAASKKIIFGLQRVREIGNPVPENITGGNKKHYDIVSTQFTSIAGDLQGLNAYRYSRNISGGCQEYVEAASFEHYLAYGQLLSYNDAVAGLNQLDTTKQGIGLSVEDYILGIYDMTGELMRFAITTMATNGKIPPVKRNSRAETDGETDAPISDREQAKEHGNILADMRELRSSLEGISTSGGPFGSDVNKKKEVMQASVEKVEKAFYGLTVRGAERPKGWVPDLSESARPVEAQG